MPVRRPDVVAALAIHESEALFAILEAARVAPRGAQTSDELATRIADALWWYYCTPLGYLADRTTLAHIVRHVARRLRVSVSDDTDAWTELGQLTGGLGRLVGARGVSLDDLDTQARARLQPSWMPTAASATGATASVTAAAAGRAIVWLGGTPVGRLLPYLPTVGPVFRVIHKSGSVAALVGGPLGIALSVLSLDQALGTNYQRLVPLLLGVGALGPRPVSDATEL
jgi:hypothetical protein